MGVADNRSYKNEYLFNDKNNSIFRDPESTAKDNPSINVDPKVNSTIKENPYRSNVEIEGKEVVLQPDLSALFNAVGKRHSKGGMDVLLKPDSFIFSDYDKLKLTKKDFELFELKEGGKKSTDTPADVLKRNIDLKHYNGLVTILGDPDKDDLAKKSAARMLDKYIKTLGNIAYIQEEKKEFPQGIPDFAMDTAPVYDTELKDKLMENKQYAKAGGTINNPYAQLGGFARAIQYMKQKEEAAKDAPATAPAVPSVGNNWGAWQGDKLPIFPNRYGVSNAADKITDVAAVAAQLGYAGPKDNKSFQQWLYNSSPENKAVIDKWHNKYNVGPNDGMFDGKIGIRWANALKEITTKQPPATTPAPVTPPQRDTARITAPPQEQWPSPPEPPLIPGEVTGEPQGVKQANWKFTPWQRASHAYDWLNALNVTKYTPDRAHYNATYTNPALVNPEQAVGDAKGVFNQQLSAANVLNPILRNAQGAQAYGQALNTIPSIRSQYDNQNVGIVNQFRQYNNQIKNNESLVNMQNDKDYSRDSTTAEVNYDNMKTFLRNTAMSNTMADASTNQKLAYSLLQQNNPAYGFDWDSGNFTRTNKSVMDVQSGQTKDVYDDIFKGIQKLPDSDPKKWEIYEKLLRQKNILPYLQQPSTPYKKGGKIKSKNPYN
jgi:hypothetical protein